MTSPFLKSNKQSSIILTNKPKAFCSFHHSLVMFVKQFLNDTSHMADSSCQPIKGIKMRKCEEIVLAASVGQRRLYHMD